MNVAALIKRNRGQTYTIVRVSGNGTWSTTDGTYSGGSETTMSVLASVQPLGADELVSIPEGDRARERRRFYTATPLKNIDNSRLAKGDRTTIEGKLYELESVEHWPNYSKAIFVTVNTDEN